MRELFFFATFGALAFTVFAVSLIELVLTVRRRAHAHELEGKIKELKANYNQSLNKLVLEDEEKLEDADKAAEAQTEGAKKHQEELEKEFAAKLDAITKDSGKALETARAKAKRLEREAREKVEEYMKNRQQEVEEDLMNLVLSVTKKVLPAGISYEAHKELVMQALKEVKTDGGK